MYATCEASRAPGDEELLTEIRISDGYKNGDPAVVERFRRISFKPHFADYDPMSYTYAERIHESIAGPRCSARAFSIFLKHIRAPREVA